jgi:hypothetical protein
VSLKVITAMYGSHRDVGALLPQKNGGSGGVGYAVQTAGNGGSKLLIFDRRAAHSHDLPLSFVQSI